MSKLLSSNITRLKKNKVFWVGMLIMFGLGCFLVVIAYLDMQKSQEVYLLEERLFWYVLFIGIFLSVFCSLFLGTEYSDGTIRNKLIVGHTRISIYLSNLIVCTIAGICMCISYLISSIVFGSILLGFFKMDIQTIFMMIFCSLTLVVVYASIYTLIAMLNQSKATTAVISILIAFSCFFVANYINGRLNEPEIYNLDNVTEEGVFETDEKIPNENYLRGGKRVVFETFNNLLPGNQALQIIQLKTDSLRLIIMYDLLLFIGITGIGLTLFKQKDIK